MNAYELIKRHEGEVLHAYQDSEGFTTIGVGRLIDKRRGGGISQAESEFLFDNDMKRCYVHAEQYPFFAELNEPRQAVVLSMIFQLGPGGFGLFRQTIKAIKAEDYRKAAREMRNSLWYAQAPNRAQELSRIMETGHWPEGA